MGPQQTVANGDQPIKPRVKPYDEHMPQSLVKILVHMVFSTKNREPLIAPEIEPQMFGYIGGIIRNNGARMIVGGGTSDHIHLLVSIGRNDVAEMIGDIKRDSSVWIKKQDPQFAGFYWQ